MAWKKPFFKRVSSKISARMLNLMTLPMMGRYPAKLSQNPGTQVKSSWPKSALVYPMLSPAAM
jgi:hypothetical protein